MKGFAAILVLLVFATSVTILVARNTPWFKTQFQRT